MVKEKVTIMFVCHGNICRSPMAEMITKYLVKQLHLEDRFIIKSSATSTEEIYNGVGNPVYPPAKRELLKHGIPCENRQAVRLQPSDYNNYRLFICMDDNNVRNAKRILLGDKDNKVVKLLQFVNSDRDVSDPWYSDRFDIAYEDIFSGCTALINQLIKDM